MQTVSVTRRTGIVLTIGLVLAGGAAVMTLSLALSSCTTSTGPDFAPGPETCTCREPAHDLNDGDSHQEFDLVLSTWIEPDPYATTLMEQQDFTLHWKITYPFEPCERSDGSTSTPGYSGEFIFKYWLMSQPEGETTGVILAGPFEIPYDIVMGGEITDSAPIDGVEVPRSGVGALTLLYEAELEPDERQECSDGRTGETPEEIEERLAGNNARTIQFRVEDCPCDGGFNSKEPTISKLDWEPSTQLLTWNTSYVVDWCGEEVAELKTGNFTQFISVTHEPSGSVLHTASIPGSSMVTGGSVDSYSVAIPPAKLTGGPYKMQVTLGGYPAEVICTSEDPPPNTASILVP